VLFVQRDVYAYKAADLAGQSGLYAGDFDQAEKFARKALAAVPGDTQKKETVASYETRRMEMARARASMTVRVVEPVNRRERRAAKR
jgi:Tfp pilus assembly protein PilF